MAEGLDLSMDNVLCFHCTRSTIEEPSSIVGRAVVERTDATRMDLLLRVIES
jgi:hypothetical protein